MKRLSTSVRNAVAAFDSKWCRFSNMKRKGEEKKEEVLDSMTVSPTLSSALKDMFSHILS